MSIINFSKWQTHTPLLVKTPGQTGPRIENRLSLHQDIAPTIMEEVLGCISPSSDYSDGVNLHKLPEQRGTIVSSYMSSAYIFEGIVVESFAARRYAWSNMQSNTPDLSEALYTSGMLRLMDEERHFFAGSK